MDWSAFGVGRTRLFPNINHPDYTPAGRLSGFGWPNLIVWWDAASMNFEQAMVPFLLVVSEAGIVRVAVDGHPKEVRPETYLAVPPGARFAVRSLQPAPGRKVTRWGIAFFNPVFVRKVWESDELRFHPIARLYPEDQVSRRLKDAVRSYRDAPNDTSIGDEEIEDLFVGLIRELAQRDREDRERWRSLVARDESEGLRLLTQLTRARELAETRFAEPLTVEDLAGYAGISKYHFIRLFERAFGLTPHRYLLATRLEHARRRLSAGRQSIGALAVECGFAGIGSFSWAFKRAFRLSPTQFAILKKSPPGHSEYSGGGGQG